MPSVSDRPGLVTAAVSVAGYAAVAAVFAGLVPFPELSRDTVDLLSHAIAAINLTALLAILVGVHAIRMGDVSRHHRAMSVAFALILTFLGVYLVKVGGGGTKLFEGPAVVKSYLYLPMLAVHLLLSVVSVPLVVDALVLGTVTPVDELPDTRHPRVGRIAVSSWGLSLALGLVTYLLLNHVYTFSYTTEALAVGVSLLGPG